jgi:hypothetical protein
MQANNSHKIMPLLVHGLKKRLQTENWKMERFEHRQQTAPARHTISKAPLRCALLLVQRASCAQVV